MAQYRHPEDHYECTLCGWTGYPEIPEGGWCQTESIICPECGEYDDEPWVPIPEPDLRGYFL